MEPKFLINNLITNFKYSFIFKKLQRLQYIKSNLNEIKKLSM